MDQIFQNQDLKINNKLDRKTGNIQKGSLEKTRVNFLDEHVLPVGRWSRNDMDNLFEWTKTTRFEENELEAIIQQQNNMALFSECSENIALDENTCITHTGARAL